MVVRRSTEGEGPGMHSAISESMGEGAGTSFGDVLDIVVPYETSGSSNTVAYGAPAASYRIGLTLACSPSNERNVSAGAQQSETANLV